MSFHVLVEVINSGYKLEWTFVLSIIATALAIFTIISKSPIQSVLNLIALFVVISLYLMIHDMPFIAIAYLLVYVGAVSILFLFILMLINVRISELLTEERNSVILAILVILVFSFVFHNRLALSTDIYGYLSNYINLYAKNEEIIFSSNVHNLIFSNMEINYVPGVTSNHWDSNLTEISHITGIGNILYTTLFAHILNIGNVLLLAMVGAIVITVRSHNKLNESKKVNPTNYINISPLI